MIKHRNGMIRPKQQNKSEECAKMQQFRRRWQPPMRLICRMRECDNEGELKKIRLYFPIVNEVLADLVTDFLVDIAREPRSVLRNNQGGMEGMMNAVLLSAGEPH